MASPAAHVLGRSAYSKLQHVAVSGSFKSAVCALPPCRSMSGRTRIHSAMERSQTSYRPSLLSQARSLHVSTVRSMPPAAPKSRDRGPKSEEDTQTDFAALNVLSNTPVPTTAVDSCMDDGFALDSGLKVTGAGLLLLSGEAFKWKPWVQEGRKEGTIGAGGVGDDNKGVHSMGGKLRNQKGQFHVSKQAWGLLDLVWPKPDLLVIGTGARILPLSPETRQHISELGIRVEVQDTRNAAAQFNLLATERGVQQIAAALVPIGWKEGR